MFEFRLLSGAISYSKIFTRKSLGVVGYDLDGNGHENGALSLVGDAERCANCREIIKIIKYSSEELYCR